MNLRWEVTNIYVLTTCFLICLTLLNEVSDCFAIKYGYIRDGRMEFGVEFRCYCNWLRISENRRKTIKHGIEGTSIMYRMVTSTEILDAFVEMSRVIGSLESVLNVCEP